MQFSISPLDGRYSAKLNNLGEYFSEYALTRERVSVELAYLKELAKTGLFPPLTATELKAIALAEDGFCEDTFQKIKEIEKTINHDVKACEVFLRSTLSLTNKNMIHFGLTSEDINNISYSRLMHRFLGDVYFPKFATLLSLLNKKVDKWKSSPFPSRTHGQTATPSTAGKEIAVFLHRLLNFYEALAAFKFSGKLNGAVGNYSAMKAAFPQFDWISFSKKFVSTMDLVPNSVTTQIEDHDRWAIFFNLVRQVNNVIIDFNQDMWEYISRGFLKETAEEKEVGSSTMPHKVNPISFENSEGNLKIANALLSFLSDKLARSRMQRDLSDSTVERNMGVALAHSYLAILETCKGFQKVSLDEKACRADIEGSYELLAEPIQTILRRCADLDPYFLLKDLSRGKVLTREHIVKLLDEQHVSSDIKSSILALRPETYLGEAEKIAQSVVKRFNAVMKRSA